MSEIKQLTNQVRYLISEEQEHIKRLMLDGKNRSWKQLSISMKYRFNRVITVDECKKMWKKILKSNIGKPNDVHMNMVIKLFEQHGSQYLYIARKMALSNSPFQFPGYVKVFIKKFMGKMIKSLELQIYKRFKMRIQKIAPDKVKRIARILTQSPTLTRGLRKPLQLRMFLLKLYSNRKTQNAIDPDELREAYRTLSKIKRQMISPRKYDKYKEWSFRWTENQNHRIYELYRAFGSNITEICRSMKDQFRQKQTYTYTIIRAKIIRMIGDGIKNLIRIIKSTEMESEFDVNIYAKKYIANKFIWSKSDKDFDQTVRLIQMGMGIKKQKNQVVQVFHFFKKFYGENRQYIRDFKKRREQEHQQEEEQQQKNEERNKNKEMPQKYQQQNNKQNQNQD